MVLFLEELLSRANADVYFYVYDGEGEILGEGYAIELSECKYVDCLLEDFWIDSEGSLCCHIWPKE